MWLTSLRRIVLRSAVGNLRVGVLALQGDFREHIRLLRQLGAEPVEVRTPEQLNSVAGLVVPGGESTAIGKLLVGFALLEPIRQRIATGMPVLGTCAGLILLADRVIGSIGGQSFIGGLPITVERNAYGSQLDSFEMSVQTTEGEAKVAFIRAPRIVSLDSPRVEPLAALNGEPVAVRYQSLFGAAFHPELTGSEWLHRLFLQEISSRVEVAS